MKKAKVWNLFRTFAAMNVKTKRLLAARLLLAVFVPMLVFACLHVHPQTTVDEVACTACVQHQCHGHMTQLAPTLHACVLCQFVSLSMIAIAVATLYIYNKVYRSLRDDGRRNVCVAYNSVVGLRAPPFRWQ